METPQPVLRLTDGLALRRFEGEADLPELFRVIEESLEHLRPWMPWVAEHGVEKTREFLAGRAGCWESRQEFTYAVTLDGAIVGVCGLFRREDTPEGGREIGYWLRPGATGRGLMTRTVRALVEEAFRLPDVEYVEVVHDVANLASGAVPARAGFTVHRREAADGDLAPAESGENQIWRLTRHGS
ncbi:GNAT family N-acetyltransferase [Streptomyces sp. NRRL WC-3742]|uniref:GNAT family N-acetyltransferase n=1 Tax=Streptomyces sp. NRRL WC-3742 TaxID=1463934 RepID=UPI0004CC8B96|nr:GNAT family N-acetyltransferase [Streptomyces sp. NRRL WC-3742]